MSTDYRALCAELLPLASSCLCAEEMVDSAVKSICRARAALAQPEPEGPTDEELVRHYDRAVASAIAIRVAVRALTNEDRDAATVAGIRAVLARWGHPTIEPVPVSERLPGPEDCCGNPRNGRGRWCWGLVLPQTDAGTPVVWRLMLVECLIDEATHWLPHHALPIPTPEGCETGTHPV